jgi:glucokinase
MRVLAADIGATNARFAIVDVEAEAARIRFERMYATGRFAGFEPALETFVGELRRAHGELFAPSRAAIAAAGPVERGEVRLPNRPSWRISRRALESALRIEALVLNDFEALGFGVARALPGDWIVLQPGSPAAQANMALVGAGTGLGVSALVWDGCRHLPVPTEAGHIAFAPRDEIQVVLWRYLLARHARVSAERVISGAGIAAIYEFLRQRDRDGQSEPLDDAAAIAACALAEPTGIAGRALDLFVACYGAFAGDIALAFLARGGLYVCGGIAAKLARRLADGEFVSQFNAKGRHSGLAASIPLRLVINEKLGLLGAARSAAAARG